MPRLACLFLFTLFLVTICAISARADSIVLVPGSSVIVSYAGTSGDFGVSYNPRIATGSAVTVFALSPDGLTLDVSFRNTSNGAPNSLAETRWLDEFNFFTNVTINQPGQFLSMPVRAVWQTSSSNLGGPLGQNIGIGTRLPLFDGNGLVQGESGLVRFTFDAPITSLSLTVTFVRLHFITTDGEGARFAYGIEARPVNVMYVPPITEVPEPAAGWLLALGLAVLLLRPRSREIVALTLGE